jgi:hypothetical protein
MSSTIEPRAALEVVRVLQSPSFLISAAEIFEAEEGEETEASPVHSALGSLLDSPRTAPIG